jgi:SAM-dependent methyltransferase
MSREPLLRPGFLLSEIYRCELRSMIDTLAKWYLSIAPASAPGYWREPKPLERARMEYEDEVRGGFLDWFPELSLTDKDVLDLGCGYGGRSVRYAELGARSLTGIETAEPQCFEAREFAAGRSISATFVTAYGESLPLAKECIDCILSYDVLEHVCDVDKTLRECLRVLRVGGSLYAVFPPFHHPTGCHFESWLSKMPWANVLFPCRSLIKAGTEIISRRADDFRPGHLRPTDKLWGINGITIRELKRLALRLDADISIDLAALFSPNNRKWKSCHMKYYAPLFAPLRYVPLLQECFTHRIVMIMRKTRR